jgi:hypothetical protein
MTISANYPSIRPSLLLDFANGQALDSRINFTRAGTGTYYDGETSALAEQNLLLQSQNFGTTWLNNNSVETSTAVVNAPDGTATAWLLTDNATNAEHSIYQGFTSFPLNTYTISCFLKSSGSQQYVQIGAWDSAIGYFFANFDLVNITFTTANAGSRATGLSATMTQVGTTGWYRCTLTYTLTYTGGLVYGTGFNNSGTASFYPSYIGTGSNYYFWGYQLEARSTVGAYQVTTTAAVTNYIPQLLTAPANTPRFDFNPTTRVSLGLLMEQQSVNLLTYSSDYTQSVWTTNNTTPLPATNISPDGTLNAQSIVENTATATHQLQVGTSQASNTTVTASIFFKSNGRPVLNITVPSTDFSGNFSAFFNATTGLVGTTASAGTGAFTSATMTPVGNGWYRCIVTGRPSTTASTTRIHISFGDTEALTSSGYAGNGYSGIFAWGAQLESTGFPTSYIPTGVSSATRTQDFATMTGTNFSSWFNNQQGTVYCSFDVASAVLNGCVWAINNNASDGYLMNKSGGALNLLAIQVGSNANLGALTAINTPQQSIYNYNNIATIATSGAINGATPVSISSPTALSFVPTQLGFGNKYAGNSNIFTGHIRKFAYYPIATTATQLQSLTGS